MCDRTALLYNTPGGMSRKIRKFCPRFSLLPFFAEKRAPPFRKGEKDRLRRGKTPVFAGRSGLLMQAGCGKIKKQEKTKEALAGVFPARKQNNLDPTEFCKEKSYHVFF